nr:MAG TPA: hypothetical protein [Bacteriophage sp.]
MAITDGGPTMTMPVAPTGMMGGGFGGENGWWVILFIILLFGWGRNGYGNNNGGVVDGYVLTSDFASVERKLDAVNNGICDSTFALNNSINGGFATAELSRANQQAALMQQLNAMQMQNQECCCENRAAIAQVRYDMATQACDTRNTVQTAARDIVENANANSRAILDFLTQSKLQDLQSANQELRLQASQAAQNNYLISQLRPTPIPSYPSCNPWASGSYTGCCGC